MVDEVMKILSSLFGNERIGRLQMRWIDVLREMIRARDISSECVSGISFGEGARVKGKVWMEILVGCKSIRCAQWA